MSTAHIGEAVLTTLYDGDRQRIRVDRADPLIAISIELLTAPGIDVDGDFVSFGDINRVTYRITERLCRHVVAEKVG